MKNKDNQSQQISRWRLILGKYAEKGLSSAGGGPLSSQEMRVDQALDFLYGREYRGRNVRETGKGGGGLGGTQLTIPKWLNEVRELFPQESMELIEKHALNRYGMTSLVKDKETLKRLEPNTDLLKTILNFKGQMTTDVLSEARKIIRKIVEEIKEKLYQDVHNAMMGRLNRFSHSPIPIARNIDWKGTIRKNLKNYDPDRQQLMLKDISFFSRVERKMPWDVILCIDQSGSMLDSVIHSAVMAGILYGLPMLKVKMVVFDTSIVDLSDYVDDPVEVLMNVQLGGGTDIGKALQYCEQLVRNPHRTVLILISDFEEGASPRVLMNTCRRLGEAGVTLLGLASLDETASPYYDKKMAGRLAENGMEIAALTPKHLAEWLGKVII